MVNVLRNEAKKVILSPVFYCSFLFMGIGFYFAQADFSWVMDGVSILQTTLGGGEWGIFGVLGCTMPYAASFCQEYLSGNLQMSVRRIGIRYYCMGKAVICFFAGGISAVLGRCLLLLLSMGRVPLLIEDPNWIPYQDSKYPYALLCHGNYGMYFCFQLFLCFLNGGFYASMGLSLSAFIPSPFMAWLAPYIMLLVFSIWNLPLAINPLTMERGWRIFPTFWANALYSTVFYFMISFFLLYLFYYKVKRSVQHGQI